MTSPRGRKPFQSWPFIAVPAAVVLVIQVLAPAVTNGNAVHPDGVARLLGAGPTYTNHTVKNDCPSKTSMKSWKYKLCGVAEDQVLEIYGNSGASAPDLPWPGTGTALPYNGCLNSEVGTAIQWLKPPTSTTVVAPGDSAHFGYVLAAGVSPSQVTGEWQDNSTPAKSCSYGDSMLARWVTPPSATVTPSDTPTSTATPTPTNPPLMTSGGTPSLPLGRLALAMPSAARSHGDAAAPFRRRIVPLGALEDNPPSMAIRITNTYTETIVIQRSAKFVNGQEIQLSQLITGTDLVKNATLLDRTPIPLRVDESVTYSFQPVEADTGGALMYYNLWTLRAYEEDKGAPPSYTAFLAQAFTGNGASPPPTPVRPPRPLYLPCARRD